GVCVPRTSTFQGQLFHHRFASAGSYAPTARRPPVRATGLRAFALRPFHPLASRRTLHLLSLLWPFELHYHAGLLGSEGHEIPGRAFNLKSNVVLVVLERSLGLNLLYQLNTALSLVGVLRHLKRYEDHNPHPSSLDGAAAGTGPVP